MGKPGKNSQPDSSASGAELDSTFEDGTVRSAPVFDDDELSPQTCCSNCHTVFEVSLEQLSSSDTRVRCGECLSIFDALANLRDEGSVDDEDLLIDADGNIIEPDTPIGAEPAASNREKLHGVSRLPDAGAAALAGLSNDTSALDVTYSDFDLFSADAGLPEVTYFDQTTENQVIDFDDLTEDENDETFNDTLFAQDVTVDARSTMRESGEAGDLHDIALSSDVDFITDETPGEPLIFNYRERETRSPGQGAATGSGQTGKNTQLQKPVRAALALNDSSIAANLDTAIRVPERTGRTWFYRSVLFLLVICMSGGLYFYRERESLQQHRLVRPVLEAGCRVLNCTLPQAVDLAAIKVLKRAVFSHPSIDNALIISIGFVNEASFSQRYPVMEIRLTDINGKLVVKNDFQPIDYLNTWQEGDVLDAGKRLDISLTVEDPGQSAASFELDFR